MSDELSWGNYFAQLGDREVPCALRALCDFDFDPDAERGYFADGFELAIISKHGMRRWSEDSEFLDGVITSPRQTAQDRPTVSGWPRGTRSRSGPSLLSAMEAEQERFGA